MAQNDYYSSLMKVYMNYRPMEWVVDTYTKPKPTIMNQVKSMAKRLLDADTQKLVKAGFLDSELDITSQGTRELNSLLFMQNKEALVKLAEEKIAEDLCED